MADEDGRLEEILGRALVDPSSSPSPERVAALRRQAEEARSRAPAPGRSRPSPRSFLAAAAAGAVAAGLIVGVAVSALDDDPVAPPTEEVALALVPPGIDADATLVNHTWGTEINLVVTGLPAGEEFTVTIQDEAGSPVPAGTFVGVAEGPIVCKLNAAVLRRDARSFEVTRPDGAVVIRSDLA